MAMTAGERKKIVKDLAGDWWRLDRVIPDENERVKFVWDVAKDGDIADEYLCNTLGNYFDPAYTQTAVDYMGRAAKTKREYTHRGTQGWDHSFEWLMTRIAEQDPKGLLAAQDRLPPMFRDFSTLFLAHQGAHNGQLPDSAKRRLAIAWASTSWDEEWYEVRDAIPAAEWSALVLDSICDPTVAQVEWDRIKDIVGIATIEQAVAIIARDHGQHVRAHASTLFGKLELKDFGLIFEAIAKIDPEVDYYGTWRRHALVEVLIAAHGRAGMDVPPELTSNLKIGLADYRLEDPEVTIAALQAFDEATREELIIEGLGANQDRPRALVAASAAPTARVLTAVIEKVGKQSTEFEESVAALAGFGAIAIEPLLEQLGGKLATSTAVMFIRALDQIGAPQAAATFVELTGASTKGIRVSASQALENLGSAAIEAVRVGAEAKKKAIRETCAALLAQMEMAGDNPLTELEKKAQKLEAPELDKALDDFRTANTHSSDDHKKLIPFADKHGILVALRVRDFFLEKADDWYRSSIWRGLVEHFERDPNIIWVAVDAFAKLPPKMYSYYVDQQARDMDDIAQKQPEAAGKALVFYLKGSPPENRAQMLETLLKVAPKEDVDVYLAAMQDTSKVVREFGIQGIAKFGESQLPAVVELLGSKKKDVRLAAAEALTRIPSSLVRTELEAALATEKTADVRTMLEQAVAAAGGSAFEFPGDDGSKVTDDDIQKFLEELNKPKLPNFVNLGARSLKFAKSGKELTREALHGLVGRLMKEEPDNQDEMARRIRPFLDDTSANALSVELKDAWANMGGAAKEKWAIYQQSILASEARLDEVAPHLDEMAAMSNHHLAKWYVDVLYRHGSRGAHSWLAYWAVNGERSSVVETAQMLLDRAAKEAGKPTEVYALSLNSYIADDVADRQVPRLGLDEPIIADYGERKFEVYMDPNHALVIRDMDTLKVTASLPKPRKDEQLDPQLKDHVSSLKKSLRSVVTEVSKRLEAGMISGRPWSVEAFMELFGGHPIMSPFAGRLVFRADDGTLFRLSEGELLDADYDAVELTGGQTIRIAHPMQMSADELDVWGEHFADAEIVQPFEQLGRAVFGKDVAIPTGKTTRGGVAGRLRRLGWRKGWAEDAGMVYTASRLLAGRGVRAWVEHGGYYVGDPSWDAGEEIDLGAVWFEDLEGQRLELDDVDALAYSEILLEVTQLLA